MDNRVGNAQKIQETFTKNGCIIKTRLGLHEVSETACANDGLILLQPCGDIAEIERLVTDLNSLNGVRAKLIDLN